MAEGARIASQQLEAGLPGTFRDIVRRDNGARVLVTGGSMPAADSSTSALVKAVARGYAWRQQLLNGSTQSIAEIAQKEGMTRRYVARILQLGFLAPDIIAAILANRLPARITPMAPPRGPSSRSPSRSPSSSPPTASGPTAFVPALCLH